MKKIFILAAFLTSSFAFAKTADFETFSLEVLKKFPEAEYVSFEEYVRFDGDSDRCLQFYEDNAQCLGSDDETAEVQRLLEDF